MIRRSRQVPVEADCEGLELTEPVVDGNGAMLLPAGVALTKSMLASLRRRGIDVVWVAAGDISQQELEAEQERVRQRLRRLFRKYGNDCGSEPLFKLVTAHRLGE